MPSMHGRANDSEDEEKPSFGGRLDHLIAGTRPSPTRQSRRLNERQSSLDGNATLTVKTEATEDTHEASSDAGHSKLTPKREDRVAVALPSIKKEQSDESPHKADTEYTLQESNTPSRSAKKRKVYDEKQFEGMKGLPDRIVPDLDILFCGINPGVRSSEEGFHYAHPSNRFYRILHESGLTPYKLKPSESPDMPEKYKLGLTDLVLRCTARADQVPSMEFQAGATVLLKKIIQYRPKMICFVGMDVYRQFRKHFKTVPGVIVPASKIQKAESPARDSIPTASPSPSKNKRSTSDVQPGLQNLVLSVAPETNQEAKDEQRSLVRLFVIPSTSGLAAGYSDADRISYLQEARSIVSAIRSSSVKEQGFNNTFNNSVVVRAEDFLEDQIVKLASGQWTFVRKE